MVRKPTRHKLGEYILAGFLALFLVWLLFLVWNLARKEEIARAAVSERKAELAALEARRAVLEANVEELATERGQEATLRQTYGVARPGEEVIIVVPPKEQPMGPLLPWWQRLFGWFGFW